MARASSGTHGTSRSGGASGTSVWAAVRTGPGRTASGIRTGRTASGIRTGRLAAAVYGVTIASIRVRFIRIAKCSHGPPGKKTLQGQQIFQAGGLSLA